ncbi:MAG: hypothetical protein PHT97_10845 [Methanoculleus sp.]|uniref:hypothetical protein n=1 Tax=Methanoculleus sp. TaxID=90427 RepID=UPI002624C083|nr:hypothetical protein [Methanoculleus sp.]MDD2255200.1 hypothetical protein [Methanoculleus sp.]MDD4471638.1 hypothetical protein [Methanoculleus sp.]
MLPNPDSLILQVRSEVANVPVQYVDDYQVYSEIKSALAFVADIVRVDANSGNIREAIVKLSAYYVYVNYTSMAESALGELPRTAYIQLEVKRQKALTFLRMVSSVPLNANLTVDVELLRKCKPIYGDVGSSVVGYD